MAFSTLQAADRTLSGHVTRVFVAVAGLVVLTLTIAAGCFGYVLAHYEPAINDLVSLRSAVSLAHDGLLDQETGLRGYLSAGDSALLEPYVAGQDELARGNAGVASLGAHGDLIGVLLDLRTAQQTWINSWADRAARGRSALPGGMPLGTFLQEGKQLFDAYRVTESAVTNRLSADIVDEQAAERTTVSICLALVIMVFIATVLVDTRLHRALRAAVVLPITDLLATMGRVRAGDFAARPKLGAGPPELREVAAELTRMTEVLIAERDRVSTLEIAARGQADKLRVLVTLSREIAGSLSLRYVAHAVSQAATSVTDFRRTAVWLVAADGRHLARVHDTVHPRGESVELDLVKLGDGLIGRTAQFGRPMAAGAIDSPALEHRPGAPVRILGMPMIVGTRVVGVFELEGPEPITVDAAALDMLVSLAGQAATAIEATRLHNEAHELSVTDAVTRLPNRRRLDNDLATEVAHCLRYQRTLSLIMLDVDHFKQFNDSYGHQAGDELLAEFGTVFADVLRETDTAYRYGGEEFCVILRETDGAGAVAVAERLRSRLETRFTTHTGTRSVTASFGVAAIPDEAADAGSLVAAADRALYVAKDTGRNRVVRASVAHGQLVLAAPREAATAVVVGSPAAM